MTDTTVQTTLADLSLAELRRELVAANHEHRAAEDELRTARALAETAAINDSAAYAALKNEGERVRFLTLALSTDDLYQSAVEIESSARSEVEAIRAEIAIHEDAHNARKADQKDREHDLVAQNLAHDIARFEHHQESESALRGQLEGLRGLMTADDEPTPSRVGRA